MAAPAFPDEHEDEQVALYSIPPMALAEQRFTVVRAKAPASPQTLALLEALKKLDMLAYYDALVARIGASRDEAWAKGAEERIKTRRDALEARLKAAESNEGESEVRLPCTPPFSFLFHFPKT